MIDAGAGTVSLARLGEALYLAVNVTDAGTGPRALGNPRYRSSSEPLLGVNYNDSDVIFGQFL